MPSAQSYSNRPERTEPAQHANAAPKPVAALPPFRITRELEEILNACPGFIVAGNVEQLVELAIRDARDGFHEVAYNVPGKGRVVEATVCKVRNGISANYTEAYMRRRDPDCMVIGDERPTNKPTYKDRFGSDFAKVRQETFEWLKTQELAVFAFVAGPTGK